MLSALCAMLFLWYLKWRMSCYNFLFLIYWLQPGWGDEMLPNEYSKKPILQKGMGFLFSRLTTCASRLRIEDTGFCLKAFSLRSLGAVCNAGPRARQRRSGHWTIEGEES